MSLIPRGKYFICDFLAYNNMMFNQTSDKINVISTPALGFAFWKSKISKNSFGEGKLVCQYMKRMGEIQRPHLINKIYSLYGKHALTVSFAAAI